MKKALFFVLAGLTFLAGNSVTSSASARPRSNDCLHYDNRMCPRNPFEPRL
jgi:hypothetical protein